MALAHIDQPSLTSSNGSFASDTMQGSLHLPESLPWRMVWRERLKKLWGYLVVTKQDGKYSISQPMALVLVGVFLTAFVAYYKSSSGEWQAQHDEIIRLQTKLDMEAAKNIDQDSKIDQARNFATVAHTNAARLEGKFDQFALTYSIQKAKNGN